MSRHRQSSLTNFLSSASATPSSRESDNEDTVTCLSSDVNDDDEAIAEESSESETGEDDDTDGLPLPKRRKS